MKPEKKINKKKPVKKKYVLQSAHTDTSKDKPVLQSTLQEFFQTWWERVKV